MVVDALYGTTCPCGCGGIKDVDNDNDANTSISIDQEMMETIMREVYDEMVDTGKTDEEKEDFVSPTLLKETKKIFYDAIYEGFDESNTNIASDKSFTKPYVSSADAFSAFRAHKEGQVMASLIKDEEGNTRSFNDWKADVEEFVNPRWNNAWLKTEFDTAVLRSKQAGDWKQFVDDAEVWPNLKWMPTSSAAPYEVHKVFWEGELTMPVDDDFWSLHHPGDHWNCKCYLSQTDDPVKRLGNKAETKVVDKAKAEEAQPGLKGLSYKTKQLFSTDHPYFPSSCKQCPFYHGELNKGDDVQCNGGKCPYNALKKIIKK